jgi:DNA repair protein RecO (recombination protein O)
LTRERIQLEPAYILARRPFRDTSLLLEVFTQQHGRVGLVARGVRGAKSQKSALLQPLRPLLVSWLESGELGTLTGVEAEAAAPALAGERLFCGWYLNELLLNLLLRHDPHPALFDSYAAALQDLAVQPVEGPLRNFELKLLAETGYGLNLGGALQAGQSYTYDWQQGPRISEPGPATYSGESLIAMREGELEEPAHLRAARRLLREALRRQLGGRELKTPKLLRELRANAERPIPNSQDEPSE